MRKNLPKKYEIHRINPVRGAHGYGDINGIFEFHFKNKRLRVQSGCGEGWDRVSVFLKHRCPTWNEMCFIKDIFWEPNETVVQFHPSKDKYVNTHRFCLHMWKPWLQSIELPPEEFI